MNDPGETNTDNGLCRQETSCVLCGSKNCQTVASGYDYEYWTTGEEFTVVRCEDCGHLYLNPRPGPESWPIIYPPDYYTLAGRHTENTSRIIAFLKKVIIRKRLSYFKNQFSRPVKILEVGCGDGSLLIDLKNNFPDVSATGVDLAFTENIITRSRREGITLLTGRIEDISLPDNEYDLVIMNQLIEHLWNPVQVLRKIRNSLASNGMISIETINILAYDRKIFRGGLWGAFYFPRHLNFFSFKSLEKLLDISGFEVCKQFSLLAPINWTFSFHAFFSRRKKQKKNAADLFFTDGNPICLTIFTAIDLVALLLGFTTSNQKTIARKKN
jgi:SAM-dependent methyltransferase